MAHYDDVRNAAIQRSESIRELDLLIGAIMHDDPTTDMHINHILSDYPLLWDTFFEGVEYEDPDALHQLDLQADEAAERLRSER